MKAQGYYNIISAATILILGLALFFCAKECNRRPAQCPELIKADTSRKAPADTSYQRIETKPRIVYHSPARQVLYTVPADTTTSTASDISLSSLIPEAQVCDTNVYADSIYQADKFKAVINDWITNNRIVHRDILWANLTPEVEVTRTVSVVKKEYWCKVYLGGQAGGNAHHIDGGPGALVTFKEWVAINYNYQIGQNSHNVGAYFKLSFHKP